MTGVRDKLANNLAKLSGLDERKSQVERHLAMERRKLTETDEPGILQEIRDRIRKIESELSDIEIERRPRLEALSTNREALRSQVNRIRETYRRFLHEDTTLSAFALSFASKELPWHRFSRRFDPCACDDVRRGKYTYTAPKASSDKSGYKEWVKNTCRPLGVRWLIKLARLLGRCPSS